MNEDLERGYVPAQMSARMGVLDATSALESAEAAAGSRVGGSRSSAVSERLDACFEAADKGERVAVVASAAELASSRGAMRRLAQARLGVVGHAIAGHGGEELAALVDLGWGVLCASSPEDSFDLTLIARRAAEDSGVPFLVVHALGEVGSAAGRAVALCALPDDGAIARFVGPAEPIKRERAGTDRGFAERVPFALGSALRAYREVSGRRHDVFDRVPLVEAPLMLVGLGPVGDALASATGELRARGYEVGSVHVTALRPFPGPRLVKALARALAVTVLEPADEPMSQGGLLAREVKSAFTDALTWAPGYPGIGRIPKLFVGATGSSFDVADLSAICDNMLADERGKRSFSFADTDDALPRPAQVLAASAAPLAVRWVLDDLTSAEAALGATTNALLASLGLRAQGVVTPRASGATVDLFAAREQARGAMARRTPRLVLATDAGVAASEAVTYLAEGSVLGVAARAGGPVVLPDAARAVVRERHVRVLSFAPSDGDPATSVAATCAGATIAAASRADTVDGALVARVVGEHFTARGAAEAARAGDLARRAFEASREALAATERDLHGAKANANANGAGARTPAA